MESAKRPSYRPDNGPKKRHVKNFLLDRRFQLRWAFRVVTAVTIIVCVMGYFLYFTVSNATDQMLAQKLGDPGLTAKVVEKFIAQADSDKRVILTSLVAGLLTLVVLIGGLTVIYTHKIAGPVYKIRRLVSAVDGHNLQLFAKLRRNDDLQQVFIDIESMLRRIRHQRRADIEILEDVLKQIDDSGGDKVAKGPLSQLVDVYTRSVEMK